jgi:peptide/nickel transport system substrate-binding protein
VVVLGALCACIGLIIGPSLEVPSVSAASIGVYQAGHRGGTLTILAATSAGSIDPQVNDTAQYWQLYPSAYDGLLAFEPVSGSSLPQVVPDLAVSLPTVTNNGRTYVFTLRRGVRFSTGQAVSARDVVASFRRLFRVSGSAATSFYRGIVGAPACLSAPDRCTLAGGVVGDPSTGKVTINLRAPDPDFLFKVAIPPASVLPRLTPARDSATTPIPGTGAYMIKSYRPGTSLVMARNPNFREWNRQAQPQGYPDAIVERFGRSPSAEVTAVENGRADTMYNDPPAERLPELWSKFAAEVHLNPLMASWYLPMNVNIPPFDKLQARQAVNWAIDRGAIVRLFGGDRIASPACGVLPPGLPGHVDACQYTRPAGSTWQEPDLGRARQLVRESGTAGRKVQVIVSDTALERAIGAQVARTLGAIGYRANVRAIPASIQFGYIQNSANQVQISLTQWFSDYPAASDFLDLLLGCHSFVPRSSSSLNISGYCDHHMQDQMDEAMTATSDPTSTRRLWARVDQEVMTASPVAPLVTPNHVDLLARRVGNYQWSRQYRMILSQLWVR